MYNYKKYKNREVTRYDTLFSARGSLYIYQEYAMSVEKFIKFILKCTCIVVLSLLRSDQPHSVFKRNLNFLGIILLHS